MPSFLLQKKRRLLFNEFNDEGMMSLLEVTTTSPCSPVGQPFVTEVDWVGSPDRATSDRGTLPTLEAVEEVAGTAVVAPTGFLLLRCSPMIGLRQWRSFFERRWA